MYARLEQDRRVELWLKDCFPRLGKRIRIILFIQSILRKLGREDRGPESIRRECVTSNFVDDSFETLSYITAWNFLISWTIIHAMPCTVELGQKPQNTWLKIFLKLLH